MTHARIVMHVLRWLVAVVAVLAASEVAARADEVGGRVVDAEGRGVKGARVYLLYRDDDVEAATGVVRTDGEGKFMISGVNEPKEGYPHQVAAAAEGFGVGAMWVQKGKRLEIRLAEETELTVPFVDEDGRPVRDLMVRAHQISGGGGRMGWYLRPPKEMGILVGRTDANGELRMKRLPRGGRVWLAVDDERYAQLGYATTMLMPDEPTMRAEPIKLMKAAGVRGRVMYEDGKPVVGIKVSAQGVEPEDGGGSGVSDGEGFYVIEQMQPGAYNIALDLAKVNRLWTARAHEGVKLELGEQKREVDFRLIPGAVIMGKALAADNGEPIVGMHIMVYGPAHPKTSAWVQSSITEKDGSYFLRVPGGEQYLYVGFSEAPDGYLMTPKKEQAIAVKDGETLNFDFPFPRGPKMPVVRGRVVDETGKGVGDCTIVIHPAGQRTDHSMYPYPTQSKEDGSFEFKLRWPSAKVRAKKDDVATVAAVEVAGKQDGEIVLEVRRNGLAGVSGLVVDARGDLIVGAKIQLTEMYGSVGSGMDTASTGRDGTFKIEGLWADGWYSVDVSAPGRAEYKSRKLDLKAGEILDLGRVVVKDLDSFISGTVFDAEGKPAVGVVVSINGTKMTPLVQVKTGADGKFRIPAVAGDSMGLFARYPNGAIGYRKVSAGEENLQMFPPVRRR